MSRVSLAWVTASVLLAGACASSVRRPEIVLNSIRVGGVGLRGATLVAELDINNQNDFDIATDSITYELFANTSSSGEEWEPVLRRTYAQRIVVEEDEVTRVEIPIEFNYTDLSGAARTILDRGMLNYRLVGNAYVTDPVRRTIPFSRTGSVSLTGAR